MENDKNVEKTERYEFGEFVLSKPLMELSAAGERVDIQKRVLDLLIYLIENRDRTVSKDELQDAVWPGTVVTESALTRAVMKARKALDDDPNEPRFLKTQHGQGYRFVGAVRSAAMPGDREGQVAELNQQRRQALLRVATTYGAGAWLLNQAAAMVWEAFEWDRWPQQALLAISVLGFPLVLGLAWFYRATPSGMALRSESPVGGSAQNGVWQRWVIAMLVVALGLSLAWNLRQTLPDGPAASRVAVLPVVNETGEDALAWVALGMMSLVNSKLLDAGLETVSPKAVMAELDEAGRLDDGARSLLGRSQGARVFVELVLEKRGESFVARGRYADQGISVELPEFGGDAPAAAIGRMAGHLVETFAPTMTDDIPAVSLGDGFVDQAFARGMHEQLSGSLEQARDLLEVAANAAPDAFWPSYELSVVLRQLGDLEGARARNRVLLETAKLNAVPVEIAVLSNELGVIADLKGELDDSAAHYDEGLAWAAEHGLHKRRAILLINYAVLERARANPLAARQRLGEAQAAYADAGIDLLPGDFFITMGNASADAGNMNDARDGYLEALEHYRLMKRPRGEALALSNLSWVSEQLADIPAAFSYLEQSERLRREVEDLPGLIKSQSRRANLLYAVGRLEDMVALADEIQASDYAQQERELLTNALSFKAYAALDLGNLSRSQTLFEEALAIDQEDGRVYGQIRSLLGLARAAIRRDALDEVAERLARADTLMDGGQYPDFALIAAGLRAQRRWRLGETDGAIADLESAADRARSQGNQRRLALLAVQRVDYALANAALDVARRWANVAHEALPEDGRVLLARARLAAKQGNRAEARSLIEAARSNMGQRVEKPAAELLATLI